MHVTSLVVACGLHESGRRGAIGIEVGESESATFWRGLLRSQVASGLIGVRLCIWDAHEGLDHAERT